MKKLVKGQIVELSAEEQKSLESLYQRAEEAELARQANELTRVEFLQRFSAQQRESIYAARAADPVVDDLLMRLSAAEIVRKDSEKLLSGLDHLVTQGFIVEADKDAILA